MMTKVMMLFLIFQQCHGHSRACRRRLLPTNRGVYSSFVVHDHRRHGRCERRQPTTPRNLSRGTLRWQKSSTPPRDAVLSSPTALFSTETSGSDYRDSGPTPPRRRADDYDNLFFVPATPKPGVGNAKISPQSTVPDEGGGDSSELEYDGEDNDDKYTQNRQVRQIKQTSNILSERARYRFHPLPPGSTRQMPPTISDYDEEPYDYNNIGSDTDSKLSGADENYGIDQDSYDAVEGGRVTRTAKVLPKKKMQGSATPIAAKPRANFFDDDEIAATPSRDTMQSAERTSTQKTATASNGTAQYPRSLRPRVSPSFMEPTKIKAMMSSNDEKWHDNNDNVNSPQRNTLPTEASNGKGITSYLSTLVQQQDHLTAQIYSLNQGVQFNINSPKQVARVLFGDDHKGDSSTNKDVLEAMASTGNEMAACIYKFRKLQREIKREQRRVEQNEKGDRKNDYYGNLARENAMSSGSVDVKVDQTTIITENKPGVDRPRREPLLLIDASAYIFRAYHAIPPLHHSDGTPTGALHGVCRMLQNLLLARLLKGERPRVVLAFDHNGPNFRHEIYPEYKANRGPCPEDLKPQFALVREAADAFGVVQVEAKGYEADDVIATLTRQAVEEGVDVDIFSGDKDLMQLITPIGVEPRVHMIDPMHYDRVNHDNVVKKWGVSSNKLGDVLALAGDASDNIPGAPGIGPKIACTLINEYGTLDNLLSQSDKVKQKKRRESLIENAEKVLLYRRLVTLDDAIPDLCSLRMSSLRMSSFDPDRLMDFFTSKELQSCKNQLQSRLRTSTPQYKPPPNAAEYEGVPF